MNKERILELADFVEKAEFKFNMGEIYATPPLWNSWLYCGPRSGAVA